MKILLTGFGPYAGVDRNPSQFLVETVGLACDVGSAVIPVDYVVARETIITLLEGCKPEYLIMFGLDKDATDYQVEAYAEVKNIRKPATLNLVIEGASYSYGSGTYVCNHTMFHALRYAEATNLKTKIAFVHVPPNPDVGPIMRAIEKLKEEGNGTR